MSFLFTPDCYTSDNSNEQRQNAITMAFKDIADSFCRTVGIYGNIDKTDHLAAFWYQPPYDPDSDNLTLLDVEYANDGDDDDNDNEPKKKAQELKAGDIILF